MKTAIFSIQHTGTWFAMHALQYLTGENCILSTGYNRRAPLVQSHIYQHGEQGVWAELEKPQIHFAFRCAKRDGYKVVVPFRDPLLALITRHNRHPELSHHYIVETFSTLAKIERERYHAFRVDLPKTDNERTAEGLALCHYLGVPHKSFSWAPRNSEADRTGMRQAYRVRDLGRIEMHLKGYMNMIRRDFVLVRFLKDLGYNLWWL